MSPCLVQQLFRQKIGVGDTVVERKNNVSNGLDSEIVDEFIFPFIRGKKHPSKELLLDIKMTRSSNEGPDWHEHSAIVINGISPYEEIPEEGVPINISPFTKIPHTLESERVEQEVVERERLGTVTGKFRREMTPKRGWGSVDIMNELRELKHPLLCEDPPCNPQDQFDHPGAKFDDIYIRLEEVRTYLGFAAWNRREEDRIIDLKFVNDSLEHVLKTGSLLRWGGNPLRSFEAVLSTREY